MFFLFYFSVVFFFFFLPKIKVELSLFCHLPAEANLINPCLHFYFADS